LKISRTASAWNVITDVLSLLRVLSVFSAIIRLLQLLLLLLLLLLLSLLVSTGNVCHLFDVIADDRLDSPI